MTVVFPHIDYYAVLPDLIVGGTALLIMLVSPFLTGERRWLSCHIAWLGVVGALFATYKTLGMHSLTFAGLYSVDYFSSVLRLVFLIATFLVILMSENFIKLRKLPAGEYYSLLMFATLGMMMMASAADLMVFFIGLEIMSVSLYVLAGISRRDLKSNEAALKYFLLGAFATGFIVFGIAFVYGAVGTTSIVGIFSGSMYRFANSELFLMIGGALLLIGLGFKLASFPFHMWVPDVYTGSPTTVTAFMSAGPKAAAIAILARLFIHAFGGFAEITSSIFWVMAVTTMLIGNLTAISQTNVKRMLAYSSIAHAGYMLMAFVAGTGEAVNSAVYYILCYTVMNIGAFAVLLAVESKIDGDNELSSFAGLGRIHPILGAAMTLFMVSLGGIPPTAGFFAKFYLFKAVISTGQIPLVVIAVINSLISVYYYLRVVVVMFMVDTETEFKPVAYPSGLYVALVVAVMAVLAFGVFPQYFYPFGAPML